MINEMTCDCGSSYICEHQAASLKAISDALCLSAKRFGFDVGNTQYFAMIDMEAFFKAVAGAYKEGTIVINLPM